MFLPNWSVKAEALYYDLGRNNNNNNARLLAITCNGATCAVPEGLFASSLITQNSNRSNGVIARAGINYHLNWGDRRQSSHATDCRPSTTARPG